VTPHQALRQQAADAAWEAMYDARAAHDPVPRGRAARAAADAVVGVVLTTAIEAIEALPGYAAYTDSGGFARVEQHMEGGLLRALVVLAALEALRGGGAWTEMVEAIRQEATP
jgi:hypothetical protein